MSSSPKYMERITDLNKNDVLLGRGDLAVRYTGNIRFRQLVQQQRRNYAEAEGNKSKDAIARTIVNKVHGIGGRFLKKIVKKPSDTEGSEESTEEAWSIADDATVAKKVKQAFRDALANGLARQAEKEKQAALSSAAAAQRQPSATAFGHLSTADHLMGMQLRRSEMDRLAQLKQQRAIEQARSRILANDMASGSFATAQLREQLAIQRRLEMHQQMTMADRMALESSLLQESRLLGSSRDLLGPQDRLLELHQRRRFLLARQQERSLGLGMNGAGSAYGDSALLGGFGGRSNTAAMLGGRPLLDRSIGLLDAAQASSKIGSAALSPSTSERSEQERIRVKQVQEALVLEGQRMGLSPVAAFRRSVELTEGIDASANSRAKPDAEVGSSSTPSSPQQSEKSKEARLAEYLNSLPAPKEAKLSEKQDSNKRRAKQAMTTNKKKRS